MKFSNIYEDEDVLIINKPSGLVVNKSITTTGITLQDQLENYFNISDLGIDDRAGIVHRLDKETSGLMVVAKKLKIFKYLQIQFKKREVRKEYITLVHGEVKNDNGEIKSGIGRIGKFGKFGIVQDGRESLTLYEVSNRFVFNENKFSRILNTSNINKNRINYLKSNARQYSLLKILPKTGRTHQIRVHLKSIGYPVVSDLIYTPSKLLKFDSYWCDRLFLHASYLEIKPYKNKKVLKFRLNLPNDLKDAILNLS